MSMEDFSSFYFYFVFFKFINSVVWSANPVTIINVYFPYQSEPLILTFAGSGNVAEFYGNRF